MSSLEPPVVVGTVCAHCNGARKGRNMAYHVYRVEGRGKPFSGKDFCSAECLAAFVTKNDSERRPASEYFHFPPSPGLPCIHICRIARPK